MSKVLNIKKQLLSRALAEWADTIRDISPEELYIQLEEIYGDLDDLGEFSDSDD